MDLTGLLVRLGSLASVLVGVAAVGLLLVGGLGAAGVSTGGLLATLALLVVSVVAAVAWGRRIAPARWETPYW